MGKQKEDTAILPDGTETEWDERLRTVGANRVPRPIRFTLRKVRVNQDGYDSVGNYWGVGDPLYVADSDRGTMHTRGKTREAAKANVKAAFPTAVFVRNV